MSCKPNYIASLLSLLALNSIILALNYTVVNFEFEIYILAFCGFFLLLVVLQRPYKSHVHNLGVVLSLLPLIYYLSWCILRKEM